MSKSSDNQEDINVVVDIIHQRSSVYGDQFKEHLLKQYEIYIEMSDRVSSRRMQINTFFITVFSSLLAISAFVFKMDPKIDSGLYKFFLPWVPLFGCILSIIWYQSIQSFKILNSSKFKIITAIEKELPCPGYSYEWKFVKKISPTPTTATIIESFMSIIFLVFWIICLIYSILIIH